VNVSWFSAGVSSAVATKLVIDEIDEIIYTHIDDQHEDTMRFVRDCEQWFGKPITILQSPAMNVENAIRLKGVIRMKRFAPCTQILKQRVRKEWEEDRHGFDLTYFWGMDAKETARLDGLRESMPNQKHRCPLIEKGMSKEEAHEILRASGIRRPAMYELGYHNNNCIGCVKGSKGYWNKIRVDFPEVFASRAKLERFIGAACIKEGVKKGQKGKVIYLDELNPEAGRHECPIVDDCGIMCELQRIE